MKTILFNMLMLLFITSKAQEVDQSLFRELKEKVIDNTYPKIDAVIVENNDNIIFEEYFNGFNKDSRHDIRSSFKSITSLLAGIAIDKKLIALNDRLERFFPELKDENKSNISVQNLLEMRSGLNCEEFYGLGPYCEDEMAETEDWVAFCLGIDLVQNPGINWSYNSIVPMLIGEIITRASGMTVMEFAERNLFQPLGIEDYKWTISPRGQGMTAGSFFMRPMDMLKIINLVRNKGDWKGKQIISSAWIETLTDCDIVIDYSFTRYSRIPNAIYESARYGFFWYREQLKHKDIDTEVLFASGNGGQYMMSVPEYNLAVVFTGSNYGNWRGKLPFEIMLKYIIPAIEKDKKI
ncbi:MULTISPECIES: serine hydrolase domain-containing protein [unclassified Sphingobacterium]|uniref:serine hydrolase domain-containing protein n=1 Tax=unclassified Sphingobacterium TaxID=2609468 RepID=UPI0025F498E2|nr:MULTISPECIES: serine hydrolase [unclassified Sphingobacterium]